MQYFASLSAGIAASALFWLADKFLLSISASAQISGMITCFIVFGLLGFWGSNRVKERGNVLPGTRVASGIKAGKNAKVRVQEVKSGGHDHTDIASDIETSGSADVDVKDVDTRR